MKLKQGNIFDDFDTLDYVGITTNSMINKNGELIMGAGVAKQAKLHNKHLPLLFGSQIKGNNCVGGYYGVLIQGKYLAFQTKRNWRDNSDIQDVINSINILKNEAMKNGNKVFGLPFPAINNGGLSWKDVIKYLDVLPDNVVVYHLEELR